MAPVPTLAQLAAFVVASIILIEIPGPSLLFALGRALTAGRRDAILSVLGNATGMFVQGAAVAVGLGALVAASSTAFTVLKLAGAAYVIYLGVQAIRHRADARAALTGGAPDRRTTGFAAVRAGFVVGVTNPKTIVFLVAFLPQFLAPDAAAAPQILLLATIFAVLAFASDAIWVLLASSARTWFARKPERLDGLGATGGVMMIGLGGFLATSPNA
ncbi:LysE family translocator [Myceligenerans crystallogenes]|uniref:LysE family translocator n=1 Tax=Myceligenerans crystallogenes TaxID=316335 RepID=A0ABN2N8E1_9MICO